MVTVKRTGCVRKAFPVLLCGMIVILLVCTPTTRLDIVKYGQVLGLTIAPRMCKHYTPEQISTHLARKVHTWRGRCAPDQIKEFFSDNTRRKKVLLWTPYFSSRRWYTSMGSYAFKYCPENRCELTIERCDHPVSDVIMFHLPSVQLHDVPGHADPRQVLAVETLESPEDRRLLPARLLLEGKRKLDGLFNWTINYKWDSDIYSPYDSYVKILNSTHLIAKTPAATITRIPEGTDLHDITTFHYPHIDKLLLSSTSRNIRTKYSYSKPYPQDDTLRYGDPTLPDKQGMNYAANRTKKILWIISNCGSRYAHLRTDYARELSKYMDVDIYGDMHGKCKFLKAKKDPCRTSEKYRIESKRGMNCDDWFMSQYKFYLAFENARCHWFITEKMHKCLNGRVLPIVLGARLAEVATVAPEDSFLHVDNFTSPRQLAEYLNYLDKNDDAYNKYFKWRTNHIGPFGFEMNRWCHLCKKLWSPVESKSYAKFSEWYGEEENCQIHREISKSKNS